MTDVAGNPEEERRADFYYQPWTQEAVCRYFYGKVSRSWNIYSVVDEVCSRSTGVIIIIIINTYYGVPQPVLRSTSQHRFKNKIHKKYAKSMVVISINNVIQSGTVNK